MTNLPSMVGKTHAEITAIYVPARTAPDVDAKRIDRKWRSLGKMAEKGRLTGLKY